MRIKILCVKNNFAVTEKLGSVHPQRLPYIKEHPFNLGVCPFEVICRKLFAMMPSLFKFSVASDPRSVRPIETPEKTVSYYTFKFSRSWWL